MSRAPRMSRRRRSRSPPTIVQCPPRRSPRLIPRIRALHNLRLLSQNTIAHDPPQPTRSTSQHPSTPSIRRVGTFLPLEHPPCVPADETRDSDGCSGFPVVNRVEHEKYERVPFLGKGDETEEGCLSIGVDEGGDGGYGEEEWSEVDEGLEGEVESEDGSGSEHDVPCIVCRAMRVLSLLQVVRSPIEHSDVKDELNFIARRWDDEEERGEYPP